MGSETYQSEFSHDSWYSDSRYLEPSERGEDTVDDTLSIGESRKRNESFYDDLLAEGEEEADDDKGGSMTGWGVSKRESSVGGGSHHDPHEDSDYDTDLEMNDDSEHTLRERHYLPYRQAWPPETL